MWLYEKKLIFPVGTLRKDPAFAKLLYAALGGADGSMALANRYFSQRYTMPYPQVKALLTDIGTEKLAHHELVATMIRKMTNNLTAQELVAGGLGDNYVEHTAGIYTLGANGNSFNTLSFQVKGDPIADLMENLAAEQKARVTYENLIRISKDTEVTKILRFLRQRSIVHFQRFGEALAIVRRSLNRNNYYAFNPSFDRNVLTNNNININTDRLTNDVVACANNDLGLENQLFDNYNDHENFNDFENFDDNYDEDQYDDFDPLQY